MKKIVLPALIFLAAFLPRASGITPAESQAYRDEADKEAIIAIKLEKRAEQILRSGPMDREKMREALQLLIQAGQLFEKAGNAYQASGINYESSQNANNAFAAMQRCLDLIQQIRAKLT